MATKSPWDDEETGAAVAVATSENAMRPSRAARLWAGVRTALVRLGERARTKRRLETKPIEAAATQPVAILDASAEAIPDISAAIFSGNIATYEALAQSHPDYFCRTVIALIKQMDPEGVLLRKTFGEDLRDGETVALDTGLLTRFVTLFNGYRYAETYSDEHEFLPVLDVEITSGFTVSFSKKEVSEKSTSFKVKLLSLSGGGGYTFKHSFQIDFGPYGKSLQLQVAVRLQLIRYTRQATGDDVFVLRILPVAIQGLSLAFLNDSNYKQVNAIYTRVGMVPPAGNKSTKMLWSIEKNYESAFDCVIKREFGELAVNMESKSESRLDILFTYSNKEAAAHIYAPAKHGVLLRAAP